ncbi:MAG: phage portal protein [Peptococcaceae bacterium BICA1-7]|nr:MAG: phage portal protein [Peptococcaceae bacterium BICA1-7]HBV95630.1 DUF2313 domain-containing protein [Desulfotomaculum sp.]
MISIPLTSDSGRAMLSYLPRYYETSRVMGSILQAQGTEMDKFHQALDETLDQFYVNTATWGLDTWEKELGLSSYAGKPDDQRRSRIISRLRGVGTTTVSLIKNVAESYVYSAVEVTVSPAQYGFTVKFVDTRGVPPNLEDLQAAVEEIKPAHLTVMYQFTYTTWGEVRNTTWAMVKTGTWGELKTRQFI